MTLEQLCEVLRKCQPKNWQVWIDTRYDERFSGNGVDAILHMWTGKMWSSECYDERTMKRMGENVDMVEIYTRPTSINLVYGEYIASISVFNGGKFPEYFELAEHFYPTEGSEFGTGYSNPNRTYVSETQINIFGNFKTFGGALRNLIKYGNSTHNHRKPKEIYV